MATRLDRLTTNASSCF